MQDKAHVYLAIRGFSQDDVLYISRSLALEPSRVVEAGESSVAHPNETLYLYIWEFISPLPETSRVDEHISSLIGVFIARADALRSVLERFEAQIHCALTMYPHDFYSNPEIHLLQSTIKQLADLNLSVTFDLFFLDEPVA